MKRIVLFVEGEGESEAAPLLVRRIVSEKFAYDTVFADSATFRVGHYEWGTIETNGLRRFLPNTAITVRLLFHAFAQRLLFVPKGPG